MQNKCLLMFCLLMLCSGIVFAQDFFSEWDLNKDGKITMAEFPGGKANMQYFREIDANRDGVITYNEFRAFLGLPPVQPPQPKIQPPISQPSVPHPPMPHPGRRGKITKLHTKLQNLQQQLEKQQHYNNRLSKQNQHLQKKTQQLEQNIAQLKRELEKTRRSTGGDRHLRNVIARLEQQNKQLQNELPKVQNQNAQLLKQKNKFSKQNQHLQKKAQQLEQNVAQLKRELEKTRRSAGGDHHLRDVIARLEQHNGQLQSELPKIKNQNAQLRQQKDQLSKQKQHLQKRTQQLEQNVAKLQNELPKVKNYNMQLLQQIAHLKKQLAQQSAQHNHPTPRPNPTPRPHPTAPANVFVPDEIIKKSIVSPTSRPAQDMLMAEEAARMDALRKLASNIRGHWIAACSKNIDGQNKLVIVGKLDPTQLVGAQTLPADPQSYDYAHGIISVTVQISRANIVESIRRTNQGMTAEEYQEIRFMFPEVMKAEGKGTWRHQGQKLLLALYGAQLDARRKLVEQLRGLIIKSSTRMENFVVKRHEVVVSIESTLLVGVDVVDQKIISNAIAQATISITRPMFIYSIRRGMESVGLKMTSEEYQNLRNMLEQKKYQFVGKAAVK